MLLLFLLFFEFLAPSCGASLDAFAADDFRTASSPAEDVAGSASWHKFRYRVRDERLVPCDTFLGARVDGV